jgi:hypothetical protein
MEMVLSEEIAMMLSKETPEFCRLANAAMHRAIGTGLTKISKPGYAVVLSTPMWGRCDLPGDEQRAARWLAAAGISMENITDAEIAAWAAWNDSVYERRRLQAEVIVTRPHSALRGHRTLEPSNSVLLRDGWGRILLRGVVKRTGEWQPDAVNRLGSRGAFVYRPDMQRIWRNIAVIQRQYPEFFMGGLSVRFNEQPV